MPINVLLKDRYYIPAEAINFKALHRYMEVQSISKANCRPQCPVANKFGVYCSTCPSKEERIKMWEEIHTNDRKYIALPSGDSELVELVTNRRINVIDRRTDVGMRSRLKWTGKLKRGGLDAKGKEQPNQKMMVSKWLKHVNSGETGGLIISPPRSGKCVVAGTIIRTENGYQPIEALFDNVNIDGCKTKDSIGFFGKISTPGQIADIKGLHIREAQNVTTIKLENGITLSGTDEHPIQIASRKVANWRKLSNIRRGDLVVLPAAYDPVDSTSKSYKGLSIDEAALMGHIIACADLMDLQSGIINMCDLDDYYDFSSLKSLIFNVLGIHIFTNVTFNIKDTILKNWMNRLFASSNKVWLSFICHAFQYNFDVPRLPSVMLPEALARVLVYHLVGLGIPVILRKEVFGFVVVIKNRSALKYVLKTGRMNNNKNLNHSAVVAIYQEKKFVWVYDLMVPETSSFITNGISSHNTVLGVASILATRSRTFISASKIRFLEQFGMRFGELTNLKVLYANGKRPVVLIAPEGWEDGPKYGILVLKKWGPEVDKADVVMSCYHQFINPRRGAKRLKRYVTNKFGMIVVDEAHQASSLFFSSVINRINARYKLGLTATEIRADKMEKIVAAILGRVAAKGTVASTLPILRLLETGVGSEKNYSWTKMETYLTKHNERNKIIVRQVFKDLRANKHHYILLPVTRLAHNQELVRMINAQAHYNRINHDEDWPIDLAVPYKGKGDNNGVINMVAAGRARVVVATLSMIKYGLDVERWTHVYTGLIPTSNAANFYQALNRVCTPYKEATESKIGEKPQPVVRIIIDQMSASVYCFAKLWKDVNYGIKGMLSGKNYFGTKLAIAAASSMRRMHEIASYPKTYSAADAGVKLLLGRTKKGRYRKKSAWTPSPKGITSL